MRQPQTASQDAFTKLKTESPDVAAFLTDAATTFGKPDAIAIRFNDGVFRKGTFRSAQDYPDFRQRAEKVNRAWLDSLRNGK